MIELKIKGHRTRCLSPLAQLAALWQTGGKKRALTYIHRMKAVEEKTPTIRFERKSMKIILLMLEKMWMNKIF